MRYFRYKNTNKSRNNALKEQYKTLTENEKRAFRKEKCWRKLSSIVTMIVYFSCIIAGVFLINAISLPQTWFLKLLVVIGKAVFAFAVIIVSGLISVALTMPLWKKVESFRIPPVKKEIFSKACAHLWDYYELREPYIVTKCFDATDRKFQNHDVCIFVVDDELRITTDLVRGFLHGERDLGCYAFKRDEITVSKQENGNHLIAQLSADDTVFLLGYRAKGFIEKSFFEKVAE